MRSDEQHQAVLPPTSNQQQTEQAGLTQFSSYHTSEQQAQMQMQMQMQ